jgi:hypothetical protein
MGDYLKTCRALLAALVLVGALFAGAPAEAAYTPQTLATVKCDNATNDAPAIQAAINAGLPVVLPAGICVIGSQISLTTTAANGLSITGQGAPDPAELMTTGRTILKPTSSVTSVFKIDGSGFSSGAGYVIGVRLAAFGIDVTNDPTAAGIELGQSFDIAIDNVRVLNGAWNECSFQFDNGSYVAKLTGVQGQYACWNGSAADAPTTQTFINADLDGISGTYANEVAFVGGAIQPPYNSAMPLVYLAPGSSSIPSAVPCTAGCYAIKAVYLATAGSVTFHGTDIETNGSYPSTCNDGTHGSLLCFPAAVVDSTDTRIYWPPALGGMYLVDTRSLGDSFDSSDQMGYNLGGGAPGDLFTTPVIFKNSVTLSWGQYLYCKTAWGGSTETCLLNAATGDLSFFPQTYNHGLNVYATGSTTNYAFRALGNGANLFNCLTGEAINGYSDNGGNLVFQIGCWQNDANAGEWSLYNPSNSALTVRCSAINGVCNLPTIWGGSYADAVGDSGGIIFAKSLTTTAAASDSVSIGGVTSSSHCFVHPTNASAATNIATTYVSAKATGSITVAHTATAGMTYDVGCTAY